MSTVTTAAATTWRVDPIHSHVEFAVRHLMISTVKGRFAAVAGTLTGDERDPDSAAIELTIPAASIDTRESQRDAHLRSADFFEADKYPDLRFRSRRVAPDRSGAFLVTGDLTIRDVTRPVTVTVHPGGRVRDLQGAERAGYSATTRISRKDFGLTWNQILEAGGVAVGDEVTISVELQLVRTTE